MRVLVIDTALGACTVAAFEDDRPLLVRSETMDRGHQERLGGLARDVMTEAGAIDRIGVTVGPGSFIGLRVGLAFAEGLGMALDRPVVGLSTLDALAASIRGDGPVLAAIDARRGQVYARTFVDGVAQGEGRALTSPDAQTLIRDLSQSGRVTVVGSGATVLAQGFHPGEFDLHALPAPTAEALARLTRAAGAQATARPVDLRAPDAAVPTRKPGQPRPLRDGAPR